MHLAFPASLQALQSNTYKQIIDIQHNRIKNPNWQETTGWLFYKRGRGFELGTTENKSSKWPERDSNPGPPDCESDALTTRPRRLLQGKEELYKIISISFFFGITRLKRQRFLRRKRSTPPVRLFKGWRNYVHNCK